MLSNGFSCAMPDVTPKKRFMEPSDPVIQSLSDTLVLKTGTGPAGAPQLLHYEILREIGRGGMSTVYEARDKRTGQQVALKLLTLPPALTPEQQGDLVGRFGREARAVSQLRHPTIIVIHEVGQQDGFYFLAMEYLPGQTLRERLALGRVALADAAPIVAQVAEALTAVHQAGIIHRDVKPSNIMLLPDGTAKLLDFGIARQSEDTTITNTGVIVGSPAYMSPEQVQGEKGTAASDVWALGILLYEMLAGRAPFSGHNIPAVLYQVTHEAPPPLPDLPPPIQQVLRRALAKDPSKRYPSALALAEALRAALPKPSASPRAALPSEARRPQRWPWLALLLIPLIGLSGIALRHHRPSAAPSPALPPSVAIPTLRLVTPAPRPHHVSNSALPNPRNAARINKPSRKPPALHKAQRVKGRVAKPKRLTAHARPRTHVRVGHSPRRRYRAIAHRYVRRVYRIAPRRSGGSSDSSSGAQLQRFIWSEGR